MFCERIICPHCRTVLQKPVKYQVLTEQKKAGGSFISFESADAIDCSVCGKPIKISAIVDGIHDADKPPPWWQQLLVWAVLIGVIALLVHSCN